jgi:hypothetical protein
MNAAARVVSTITRRRPTWRATLSTLETMHDVD